jgi:deoxycytidylate deaminase
MISKAAVINNILKTITGNELIALLANQEPEVCESIRRRVIEKSGMPYVYANTTYDALMSTDKDLNKEDKKILNNSNRPSFNDYYLNIAKAVSERSTCLRRHYGAVIVKDNHIVIRLL